MATVTGIACFVLYELRSQLTLEGTAFTNVLAKRWLTTNSTIKAGVDVAITSVVGITLV